MRLSVLRLELARIRTCAHCGRGSAVLHAEDGTELRVALDPIRAQADSRPESTHMRRVDRFYADRASRLTTRIALRQGPLRA